MTKVRNTRQSTNRGQRSEPSQQTNAAVYEQASPLDADLLPASNRFIPTVGISTIAESPNARPNLEDLRRALSHTIPTVGNERAGSCRRKPSNAWRYSRGNCHRVRNRQYKGSDRGTAHRVLDKTIPTVGMMDAPKQVNACIKLSKSMKGRLSIPFPRWE